MCVDSETGLLFPSADKSCGVPFLWAEMVEDTVLETGLIISPNIPVDFLADKGTSGVFDQWEDRH